MLTAQLAEFPSARRKGRRIAAYGGCLVAGAIFLYVVMPLQARVFDGWAPNLGGGG